MQVSIIIVNYNTKELIKNCINSIYKYTQDIQYEIIVSDNGSTDGSIEMLKSEFPNVILIENNANLGFGTANNRGLKIAKGKYIFYLNSDTVLLNNAVKIFYDYWENASDKESIGALGCNLLKDNYDYNFSYGKFGSFYGFLKELIKLKLHITNESIKKCLLKKDFKDLQISKKEKYIGNVDYISGAALFVKNNEIARFDEKIFLYFEEVDLQYSMYKQNLSRILIDGPEIIHYSRGSSQKILKDVLYLKSFSQINQVLSKFYYYKKNICNNIQIEILKQLQILVWKNKFLYDETKSFIIDLKKI